MTKDFKLTITEVLYRFYKVVYDDDTELDDEEYKKLDNGFPFEEIYTEDDNACLDLDDKFMLALNNLYRDYKDKYCLHLGFASEDGDYRERLTLYGTRKETDEEFQVRFDKEQKKKAQEKERSLKRKEKVIANKELRLQQLAKELGKSVV